MYGRNGTRTSRQLKVAASFFLLTCLVFVSKNGLAQVGNGDIFLNNLNNAYVKSIDEFILRFNAERFHPGINPEEESDKRIQSLASLVDYQRFLIDDSAVASLLVSFFDSVCWNDILLNIESGDIYAEAQSVFEYKQQKIPINLVLKYENIRDDYYKWAIVGANGLTDFRLIDTSCNGYINPIQHEMHFSELTSACESDLTRFVSADRQIDQLFFLLGMIKTGQMNFVACNKVLFHFMQIPGFVFVVGKANRLSYNSGYLINTIIKIKENNKQRYIKQLLGLYNTNKK